MISERVPCQATDVTMVLMRIIAAMCEDDVRVSPHLQLLEPRLDCFPLFREEPVAERHHLDLARCRVRQNIYCRGLGFCSTVACTAQHAPMDFQANAAIHHAQ